MGVPEAVSKKRVKKGRIGYLFGCRQEGSRPHESFIFTFSEVLTIVEIGCRKGAIWGAFLDRKVAGGGLGVDLASHRDVQKGSAKKGPLQGVQGDRKEGGGPYRDLPGGRGEDGRRG